jgi:hypothetical protein
VDPAVGLIISSYLALKYILLIDRAPVRAAGHGETHGCPQAAGR